MADDEDSAKTEYDKALEELAKLFCGIDKIIVHQYGFVLFYLPVYELLLEIKRKSDEVKFKEKRKVCGTDNSITIEFINYDSDIACCEGLIDAIDLLGYSGNNNKKLVLNLGLSEPPSSLVYHAETGAILNVIKKAIKENKYLEIPFIRNFPLWGMALANNPKIVKMASEQASSLTIRSGVRYWDHFASNVTILSEKNADQFVYSVHSTTSTTFLEFKKRISEDKDILVMEPNKTDRDNEIDEFTFVFRGQADIALTHQPWVGIKRGSSPPTHRGLEIVYTHVWGIGRKPASALYFFANEPNNFHTALARLFAETVENHVEKVSAAWTPEQMQNLSIYYCGTVLNNLGKGNEHCLHHNCRECIKDSDPPSYTLEGILCGDQSPDSTFVKKLKCREETAVGYQICIHNQIFFDPSWMYGVHDIKSTNMILSDLALAYPAVARGQHDNTVSEGVGEFITRLKIQPEFKVEMVSFDLAKELAVCLYYSKIKIIAHNETSANIDSNDKYQALAAAHKARSYIEFLQGTSNGDSGYKVIEHSGITSALSDIISALNSTNLANAQLISEVIDKRNKLITETGASHSCHTARNSFSTGNTKIDIGELNVVKLALALPFNYIYKSLPWNQISTATERPTIKLLMGVEFKEQVKSNVYKSFVPLYILIPIDGNGDPEGLIKTDEGMHKQFKNNSNLRLLFDYYLLNKNRKILPLPHFNNYSPPTNGTLDKLIEMFENSEYAHIFSITCIRKNNS